MTDSPKPTTKRKPSLASAPTEHKLLVLCDKLEIIEDTLNTLASAGWTVHLSNVQAQPYPNITVTGWASR
jgi:hypothetical protein